MKKWKQWKRGIAAALAAAMLFVGIPASAGELFTDGGAPALELEAGAGESAPAAPRSDLQEGAQETGSFFTDMPAAEEPAGTAGETETAVPPSAGPIEEEPGTDVPPAASPTEEGTEGGEAAPEADIPPEEEASPGGSEIVIPPDGGSGDSAFTGGDMPDIFSSGEDGAAGGEAGDTAVTDMEGGDAPAEYPTYDSPTIAEILAMDPEQAWAATELLNAQGMAAFALAAAEEEEEKTWSFDAYYVGQDDPYYVSKTDDFTLKYQMEFHTDYNLDKPGDVVIRIPRALLKYRDRDGGALIYPSDIAVPEGGIEEDGTYKKIESRVTPFNYYVDGNDLVFYNYKPIQAGTNAAWQVLYKNLDVSKIVDGTTWSLTPMVAVEKEEPKAYHPLEGVVHTDAILKSVTKDVLDIYGKSYGPGLYTRSQVESVLGRKLDGKFDTNFEDYVYVGWTVKVDLDVVQPVSLSFADMTTYGDKEGKLVGFSCPETIDYYTEENAASDKKSNRGIRNIRVVTAYPKEAVKPGDQVDNTFTVNMTKYDTGEQQERSDDAFWIYKPYYWQPPDGEIYQTWKTGGGTYPGWLNVFEKLQGETEETASQYLDSFPFTVRTSVNDYTVTHYGNSEDPSLGQRREGSYYMVETADGIYDGGSGVENSLYAYSNTSGSGAGKPLMPADYYLTGISIQRTDRSYDVWEDRSVSTPETDEAVDQDIQVYASYDGQNWEEIHTIPEEEALAGKRIPIPEESLLKGGAYPVAVKAIYKSINYESDCRLSFRVQLKNSSPVIKALMEEDNNENMSITVINTSRSSFSYHMEGNDMDWGSLYRSDEARISRVGKEANAYKTAKVSNDTINGRVLVDYNLTAWLGYEVYSQAALNYLRGKNIDGFLFPDLKEGGKEWVFYDLLPYGMTLEPTQPVTAGRITNLDPLGHYQDYPQSWDQTGVTVSVEPEDVTDDWKGTGRTMVRFHLKYSGIDPTVYSRGMWMEGWGVSFRARYDWEDLSLMETEKNQCAFTTEKPNVSLLDVDGKVYANGEVPGTDYDVFKNGIRDGEPGDPEVKNILYAQAGVNEDVPVASTSTIKKLVRADADRLNDYGVTAVVNPEGTYTYDVTVTSGGPPTKDIVIYDRLEYAVADRSEKDTMNFGNATELADVWQGTFLGVDTTELESLGINAKVYYSDKQDAARPRRTDITGGNQDYATPDDAFKSSDWVPAEDWTQKLSEVRAVAVDIRRTTEGEPYILPAMEAVGFKIRMQAPPKAVDAMPYTYNNPAFYSKPVNSETQEMVVGNSVRVELAQKEGGLTVRKEFDENEQIPEELLDQAFTFTITYPALTEGGDCPPFAYQEYTLWKKDGDGNWKKEEASLRTTDKNGSFTLHADEEARFEKVRGAEKLLVAEEENPFWRLEIEIIKEEPETDAGKEKLIYTFKNHYRPVLYIQKKTQAVPEDQKEEIREQTFAFSVEASYKDAEGNVIEQNFAGEEYWLVDAARTDGSIPNKVGTGKFDKDGILYLKESQIAAVRLDSPDSHYTVTELLEKNSQDWLCDSPEKEGDAALKGSKVEIINTYRWKELLLTKEITHQDKEDVAKARPNLPFTFEVKKVVTDADGKEQTEPVTGNTWTLLNTDGSMPGEEGPDETEPGETVSGTLDADGRFTCAMAGRTVKIGKLEAGATYLIYEVDYKKEGEGYPDGITEEQKKLLGLYEPVNGGMAEVEMPIYSANKNAVITNDYRKRPLTVSKQVILGSNPKPQEIQEAATRDFTMTVYLNGKLLANAPYELRKNGQKVDDTPRETDEKGALKLRDGESAYFKEIGVPGDTFEVKETPDAPINGISFKQIYPTEGNPSEGILSGDGGTASFVNGVKGFLVLSKEYVGGDAAGSVIAGKIAADAAGDLKKEFSVEARVELYDTAGKLITGSENAYAYLQVLDTATGEKEQYQWYLGKENGILILEPGKLYIIPQSLDVYFGGGSKTVSSYKITELKTDYAKLFEDTGEDGNVTQTWIHIRQKPEGAITGTIEDDPVAKLVNEITTMEEPTGSLIEKRMAINPETRLPQEVPEGAALTLQVEQYSAQAQKWLPAEGVPYLVSDHLLYDGKGYDLACTVTEGRYGVTGADGRLRLTKSAEAYAYPVVQFLKDEVKLNLYGDPETEGSPATDRTMRLVEVPEETDASWGFLAGYGKSGSLSYSMEEQNGTVLYNNRQGSPVEIAKAMDTDSDETFTMILMQVLSAAGQPITEPGQIRERQAVPGIAYTVYDSGSGEEIRRGETGKNGEIPLRAGQYARLELPEDTKWTVEELLDTTAALKDLIGTPEEKMSKLSDNLMLLNQPETKAEKLGTITYDANGGRFGEDADAPTMQHVTYYMEDGKPVPVGEDVSALEWMAGKVFEGWYRDPEGIEKFDLMKYKCEEDLTVYAKWKQLPDVKYAVALYGIGADSYEDGGADKAGLTFGPATGADYTGSFKAHTPSAGTTMEGNAYRCLHNDTWAEIIEWSEKDPYVYGECLTKGCTHSVELSLNDTLKKNSYFTMSGDGAGVLYNSIKGSYLKWNEISKNTGGWPASRIRATLNGADSLTNKGVAGSNVLDVDNCLLTCFPEELQRAIVAKEVKSDTVYSKWNPEDAGYETKTTYDKLWLFSGEEYFGETIDTSRRRPNEGSTYAGAKACGSRSAAGYHERGDTNHFWLRSASRSIINSVYYVNYSGGVHDSFAGNISYGLSPGFCIR